ncbi:hypothetical protein Acid345_2977 [Candidatus Koribacter versatilis Ellin345]|uniref:Uncharacterized protein n=1 Tax=Koribacter versatilis (strain Ellin345) TaxID=204669 RepID=Q1IMC2_KORVE|nr:hypothetical protein [Candidatus Koribacter versatilis]ABF41978.1 hypothetical protein Acid345_2977 [Candidatus Koribacter versatilis Ellin345]
MTVRTISRVACAFAILSVVALHAQKEPKRGKACSAPHPEQYCTAQNTCGGNGQACTVGVERTGDSAKVTASSSAKKGNALFCVKKGSEVSWEAAEKNLGFVIDVKPVFPFDKGEAIIGGSGRPVPLTADKTGCFTYTASACKSGSTYGMCKTVTGNFIIVE